MGWFRNLVSVVLPGVPQTFDAFGQIADGKLPIPKNPLPLPDPVVDAIVPDRVKAAWEEHIEGENDKFRGLWNDAKGSVGDFFTGVGEIASGDFSKGAGHIWGSATRGVTGGIGVGLIDVRRNVAVVQTLIGTEAETRRLTGPEREALVRVFGDSIDPDAIRLKVGGAGIGSINDRAFTSGNTIYMKKDPNRAEDWPAHYTPEQRQAAWVELLVHESVHVWQFQNFGSSYQANSLGNQALSPAVPNVPTVDGHVLPNEYNWMIGQDQGKGWEELNDEQKAELIEMAWEHNFYNDASARLVDDQGRDRTEYIREGMRKLRERRG